MNKGLISALVFIYLGFAPSFAQTITGQVEKAGSFGLNQVVDERGIGVPNAKVLIPQYNYSTYTNSSGHFDIKTRIGKDVILSVEKSGFRPFSLTIGENVNDNPLILGIARSQKGDIVVDTTLYHLGDNNFSPNSANSGEFKTKAAGIYLNKSFKMTPISDADSAYLIIGSVIGLDTKMAHDLRQNNIRGAYSSPAQIFFNGQKIGELKINGDNQKVPIPTALIRENNELTIKTGKNLFQHGFADYDDMEIMNLSVEVTEKQVFSYIK